MTVTWLDVPGSTLADKDDPVDFTTSATPPATFLSVSFGASRPEEIAYRDGAFVAPYTASTRTGNTFSLKRSGGWPSAPTVYVEEPPEAPVPVEHGGSWQPIYEVDFAALPNQTLASGRNLVDGTPWWVKGDFSAGESLKVINGVGLRLIEREAQNVYAYATGTFTTGFAAYLDFAEALPTYNAQGPVAVQYRFADLTTNAPGNRQAWGALASCAKSSARVTDSERVGVHGGLTEFSVGNGWKFQASFPGGSLFAYNNFASTYAASMDRQVMLLMHPGVSRVQWFDVAQAASATAWPVLGDGQNIRIWGNLPRFTTAPSLGFLFFYEDHMGPEYIPNYGQPQYTLRSLRVMQAAA